MHWKHKARQDLKPQWRWSTRKSQCTQNSDSFLWMSLTSALSLSVKPGGLWRVGHYLPIGNSGLEISPNLWNKDKLTLHQHGRQWVCCLLPRCWQDRLEKQASLTSDVLVWVFQAHPLYLKSMWRYLKKLDIGLPNDQECSQRTLHCTVDLFAHLCLLLFCLQLPGNEKI